MPKSLSPARDSVANHQAEAGMRKSIDRMELVHDFLKRAFSGSLHAKRILSLANGTLGVLTGASLAVSVIGHALAQARGRRTRHAIKQVDRLLSNAGIVVWDLFAPWAREVVGQRKAIVVAMDWTDFDADNQATLALSLITRHGRATPLLWLTVDKDELKDQRAAPTLWRAATLQLAAPDSELAIAWAWRHPRQILLISARFSPSKNSPKIHHCRAGEGVGKDRAARNWINGCTIISTGYRRLA